MCQQVWMKKVKLDQPGVIKTVFGEQFTGISMKT